VVIAFAELAQLISPLMVIGIHIVSDLFDSSEQSADWFPEYVIVVPGAGAS
jgi:hypothetical protein